MAKRTQAEREQDLLIITDMYCKNYSVRSIADKINNSRPYKVSYQTVFNDIQQILQEWKEKKENLISVHVAVELEKSLIREQKLWEAWEKSENVKKSTQVRKRGKTSDGPENIEIVKNEEDGIGNFKFMELMQKEADFRCKLLGSFAPTKVEGEFTGNLFFELMKQASIE